MSIYISGVEMPKEKTVCLLVSPDGQAFVKSESGQEEKYQLMPVPKHGRTIDADVLFKEIGMDVRFGILTAMCIQSIIHDAPTIIPADAEKEE